MSKRRVAFRRDERVLETERQATSMALPAVINLRLDELVRLAVGASSNRAEVIATLIAFAPLDGDEMDQQISAYRKSTVGDVIPRTIASVTDGDDSVVVPLHGPGRRKKQDTGG